MDREECEAGQDKDQDILNIPFIDDDNDDDNDEKVRRKEGINRPHEKLRTIQHITDHRGSQETGGQKKQKHRGLQERSEQKT